MKPHSKIISRDKEYILGTEPIAAGSFGQVWTAWDGIRETIAVKFFAPQEGLSFKKYEPRFAEEAKRMMTFRHEHIVSVYDFQANGYGEIENPYYTMEQMSKSLETLLLNEKEIPLEQGATIIIQLCEALQYAYRKEIKSHNDIHPGNILLTERLQPKLGDFGMMLLEGADIKEINDTAITAKETIGGMTNRHSKYTAPEVRDGGREHATQQSDIYSLGIILDQLMEPHIQDERRDELIRIADNATRTKPEFRYKTLEDLATDVNKTNAIATEKTRITVIRTPQIEITDSEQLRQVQTHAVLKKNNYLIDFDVVVDKEGTLEIEPGTQLRFTPNAGIISYGKLIAKGNSNEKISFTNYSIGKHWHNIVLQGECSGGSLLEYCTILGGTGRKISELGSQGGGVLAIDTQIGITNTTFQSNFATRGGAVALIGCSSSNLHRIQVYQNKTLHDGALFCADSRDIDITGTFKENRISPSGESYGAMVDISIYKSNAVLSVHSMYGRSENILMDCASLGAYGSRVFIKDSSIRNCWFSAANFAFMSALTIEDTVIEDNNSKSGACDITDHSSSYAPEHTGPVIIRRTTIQNNESEEKVGGLFMNGIEDCEITESEISHNTSKEGVGGICAYETNLNIMNSKIKHNKSGKDGNGQHVGGLQHSQGNLRIHNTEIENNKPYDRNETTRSSEFFVPTIPILSD